MRRALAGALLLALAPGAAVANKDVVERSALARARPAVERWAFSTLATGSDLTGARAGWTDTSHELLFQPVRAAYGGARIETRARGDGTDTLYTGLVSHMPSATLEWHAALTEAPDAAFSARRAQAAGIAWQPGGPLALLGDYRRFEFAAGRVEQAEAGLGWALGDATSVTARYVRGRAFAGADYDGAGLRLDTALPRDASLSATAYHGTDPQGGFIADAVLARGTTLALYGRVPLRGAFQLILGGEYEARDAWSRIAAAAGFSVRF